MNAGRHKGIQGYPGAPAGSRRRYIGVSGEQAVLRKTQGGREEHYAPCLVLSFWHPLEFMKLVTGAAKNYRNKNENSFRELLGILL